MSLHRPGSQRRQTRTVRRTKRRGRIAVAAVAVLLGTLAPTPTAVRAEYEPGIPPEVDPGTPTFAGSATPVPAEPAAFDPTTSTLESIYDADLAAGGTSFWFDRILARPFLSNQDDALFTRGRALYMYTHQEGTLGFAGGYAYRERPTGGNQNLYSITIAGTTLTETTAERIAYPSHWTSVHTGGGLSVAQKKFITDNNVAVTILTLTNTGGSPTTRTLSATSPIATNSASGGTELTGTVTARYSATTFTTRFSGDGFAVSGTSLQRNVSLDPGASTTLKLVLGTIATELPGSANDYVRYRDYDANTALLTHLREYNRWWVDNVPYVDIPDQNVKKMVYYRTFLNRYNYSDANIPGNDHQFPVSIEGVTGYNNAIQLTQPMHIQDLKYFRDPLWSYGNWVSSGETSHCTAFTDNPGSFSWGNTYEQYIGREAWNAYKVHGGDPAILNHLAHYAECDVKGQLAKYDKDNVPDPDPANPDNNNDNNLIAYSNGALTGNDADAVALAFYQRGQDRTESAFWYSGAKAAAEAYALLGNDAKAAEMNAIAEDIKDAILTLLWDDSSPDPIPPQPGPPATRVAGQLANALPLVGANGQYVDLPDGIVSTLNDFTIATWVNPTATTTWSRVFDFGTGTTANMFLTVNGGGVGPRFAITTGGGGAEQQLTRPGQLPTNAWTHIAITLSGNTGRMYVNGALAVTNTSMTLRPSSLGNTTNNWIGRSQYNDPLLNAAVDDFQIYDHALSDAEIAALATPTQGAGNIASYRFDEAGGNAVVDSSGNGRDATVIIPDIPGDSGGKVFKQRDVRTGNLVPWKDQQNFTPFTEGIPPNTDEYKLALRFYADRDEFPIMPSYTANQTDKAAAVAAGRGGSNNFSNINSTLQAQLYARALREYPSDYITPDMYRRLIEWLTWNEYINGDNRFPDNNEFFFNWNPTTQTLGRSGIHHNILGAFNFMIVEDVAGIRPRLDDTVELWPIDMGYSHFAINNLSYHGRDLTIVWDRPGDGQDHYGNAPEGYSAYLDGSRILTVDDLAHLSWNAGSVTVEDGSSTDVVFSAAAPLDEAVEVGLSGNARVVDMFQKAGLDLSDETHWAVNLALGKPVTASFTTMSPTLRATAPEFAVDGWTISGLPAQINSAGYVARNTIWGTEGASDAQQWFEVDFGKPTRFDTVKLYYFSDKTYAPQTNPSGNTYRQPASYTIQYLDGDTWVDVPRQVKTPTTPQPNYNADVFPSIVSGKVRLQMTRTGTFGIGLKEIQVFDTNPAPFVTNDAPDGTASVQYSDALDPTVTIAAFDPTSPGSALEAVATGLPEGLSLELGDTSAGGTVPGTRTWTIVGETTSEPGTYPVSVTVTDDEDLEGTTAFDIEVLPEDADATYTGDALAFTPIGGTTADVLLRATIRDSSAFSDDEALGDITSATVTFSEAGNELCEDVEVELIGAATTVGTATCTVALGIDAHQIDITVDGNYTATTSGLVEVAAPDGSFITGGATIVAEDSAGTYAATSDTTIQVAFNVKYQKNQKNLKGHADVILESDGKTYEIASNAIDSLGIALQTPGGASCVGPPSATCLGRADFRSKATLTDITDPLGPSEVAGNLSLQVTVTDRGEPGTADTIGITLLRGSTLLFSSSWNGSKTLEVSLDSGNLVVH